jgi:hypothetical protein
MERAKRSPKVGYGRPPLHTRFKSGASGNPKGRPKGTKNIKTLIDIELSRHIEVVENGVRKKMPKREAFAKRQVNEAIGGNHKAATLVMSSTSESDENTRSIPDLSALQTEADDAVIQTFIQRIRQSSEQVDQPSPSNTPTKASKRLKRSVRRNTKQG